jgi:predicted phosphodiesterase
MKIGFIADIHEDIRSLQDAFKLLERMECDSVICLGDLVGFNILFQRYIDLRNADKCLTMVKENCSVVVAGNHDLYAVKKIPEHKAGFNYREDWYGLNYDDRAKLSKNKIWLYEDGELPHFLSNQSAEYLQSLPEYFAATLGGINFLFSHFNYPDLTGSTLNFPKKATDLDEHFRFMNENVCSIGVSGHGHIEGFAVVTKNKLDFRGFGSYQLERETQWLVCPCIANTARSNGIMVFDTNTFQLIVVPLESPKIIV